MNELATKLKLIKINSSTFRHKDREFILIEYNDGHWAYDAKSMSPKCLFSSKEDAIRHIKSTLYLDKVPENFVIGSEWWVPLTFCNKLLITKATIKNIGEYFISSVDRYFRYNYLGVTVDYEVDSYPYVFQGVGLLNDAKEVYPPKIEEFFKANPEEFIKYE